MDKPWDEKIENEVHRLLFDELGGTAEDLKVQCRDGHITLSGFVNALSDRRAAEKVLLKVDGIRSIENCITVTTDRFTDKDTEDELLNKFAKHSVTTPVTPKVSKGTVVLEGCVGTLKEKNIAVHQASSTAGVKDVVSHITIESKGKYDDITIHNSIQRSLVNRNMDHNDIRVAVEAGSVKLSGYVETFNDIEAATEITSGIPGVTEIVNHLRVRK